MDDAKRSLPTPELVEQYRRELLRMHRQQTPPTEAERSWLDERYPLPDIDQDRTALAAQAPPPTPSVPPVPIFPETVDGQSPPTPPVPPPPPPVIGESPFVGYLRVFVFTANGAEPLEGARVVVSRQEDGAEVLYANAQTDRDGFTPVIPLPSVDPALSMRPDSPQPFVPYDITVNADGFRSVRHENVPVYGNNYVTQPVSPVPLMPGTTDETTQQFQSGGPADL